MVCDQHLSLLQLCWLDIRRSVWPVRNSAAAIFKGLCCRTLFNSRKIGRWPMKPLKVMLAVVKVKGVVWTPAPHTWLRLVTSGALQSRKWQLIGMSQGCRSALCDHPLPILTDNWTHGAASRHTIAPISHTRPSPCSRSYYSLPVPLRVGGWVGLSTQ